MYIKVEEKYEIKCLLEEINKKKQVVYAVNPSNRMLYKIKKISRISQEVEEFFLRLIAHRFNWTVGTMSKNERKRRMYYSDMRKEHTIRNQNMVNQLGHNP